MSAELMLELAWKSALFAAVTLVLLRLFRGRSPAERSWIANTGLAALILLPLTLFAGPQWRVIPPEPIAAVMPAPNASAIPPASSAAVQAEAPGATSEALWPVSAKFLIWAYAFPAAMLALLLLLSVLRLYLLRRRADVLVEPSWSTALSAAQRRMRFKHGTALLVSEELRSPISWGVVRPIILLDRNAASDSSQAEAIIAHELAHVARLDWAMLIVGRLATAIYWFNPLVWLLARSAHELSEQAVDDTVLASAIPSTDYARLLIDAVCHDNRAVLLAANGVTGCGALTRRVERVLDPSVNRKTARSGWVLACCSGALIVGGPLAAFTLVPERYAVTHLGATPSNAASGSDFARPASKRVGPTNSAASEASDAIQGLPPGGIAAGKPAEILSPVFAEAMIFAARKGDMQTLSQLLASGTSANAVRRGDGTPLIAAVRAGRRDVAEFLLHNGASPNLGVPGDGSPLTVAARAGRRDLVELLLARGASVDTPVVGDGTALIAAAGAGHVGIVSLLLDRGANIEKVVPEDENALITASRTGHPAVVGLLIARGANVNSRAFGRTPLAMARLRGHDEIVTMLTKAGAVR